MSSRTSTATSRCRACGALLAGGPQGRACPRCHPEDEATAAAQLELSLSSAPAPAPPSTDATPVPEPPPPAPAIPSYIVKPRTSPTTRTEASAQPAWRPPTRSSPIARILSIAGALAILAGGLSWAGFQMWPRGSVEKSIVQAMAALPHFYERTGSQNPLHALAVESESSPSFIDLNGDGLLDLVTGSRAGGIHIVRNTGSAKSPRFAQPTLDGYGLVPTDTSNAITFADLHGRGRPDAVNAGTNGGLTFFENRGSSKRPNFVLLSPDSDPFGLTSAPPRSLDWRPVFADLDRDGDSDLLVGTRDGTILYFENRGTRQKPSFHGVTRVGPFGLRSLGDLVSLSFGDVDGDGDLDAVAGNAAGELRYVENRGNAWRPKFSLAARGAFGLSQASRDATVALVDLDTDGDLDCVTGGADGRFRYFENVSERTPVR